MDNVILMAARLAADAHNGQTRKWGRINDPYILHPMRVAGRVAIYPLATEDMVAAAWLHDILEDTKMTEQDLIAAGLGGPVTYFVKGLTNPSKVLEASRDVRKQMDRDYLVRAPWEVRFIKLADRLDNVREMNADPKTPVDFDTLYRQESLLLLDALRGTDEEIENELIGQITRGPV